MTQHDHATFVPGCYRCDLSAAETADPRPQPSMYAGAGRCTDCGAAVGMRHDADCPNYPQPDAAPGECTDEKCPIQKPHDHGALIAWWTQATAPPSAPASAPDAGFEAWHDLNHPEPTYNCCGSCWETWDAAQRQHAAEVERWDAVATARLDLLHIEKGQTRYLTAALEAAQQEGAKLRYELAFAAPQFHGKGEQMEGRWHCRVCGVFGQGYDTIKHRDTCPLYGYDYTTARSTLAATPPAAPTEAQEPNLRRLCAACGHMTIEHDLHARDAHCQECACPGFRDQPPPAGADALREDG